MQVAEIKFNRAFHSSPTLVQLGNQLWSNLAINFGPDFDQVGKCKLFWFAKLGYKLDSRVQFQSPICIPTLIPTLSFNFDLQLHCLCPFLPSSLTTMWTRCRKLRKLSQLQLSHQSKPRRWPLLPLPKATQHQVGEASRVDLVPCHLSNWSPNLLCQTLFRLYCWCSMRRSSKSSSEEGKIFPVCNTHPVHLWTWFCPGQWIYSKTQNVPHLHWEVQQLPIGWKCLPWGKVQTQVWPQYGPS